MTRPPTVEEFATRLSAELRQLAMFATDQRAGLIYGSVSQLVLEAARPVEVETPPGYTPGYIAPRSA